jgi:hypothetical protein
MMHTGGYSQSEPPAILREPQPMLVVPFWRDVVEGFTSQCARYASNGPHSVMCVESRNIPAHHNSLFVGAWDPMTLRPLWPPVMVDKDASGSQDPLLVAGNHVILRRSQSLTGVNLSDGKIDFNTAPLGVDYAGYEACTDGSRLWLVGREVRGASFVEVPSGVRQPAPRPEWCAPRPRQQSYKPVDAPWWPGYLAAEVRSIGRLRVASGLRVAAPHLPAVAVAVDNRLLWSQVVPAVKPEIAGEGYSSDFAVDGERLYVVFDAWVNDFRLVAFDLRDGHRVWEKPIAMPIRGLSAVGGRVYELRWKDLVARDAATGEVAAHADF